MQPDSERFADIVALAMKTVTAPLLARIVSLENRAAVIPRDGEKGDRGEQGPPGRDAEDLTELKKEIARLQFDLLGIQTKSLDMEADVPARVQSEVTKAVAAIEIPQVRDGRDGVDGQSVTVEDVAPMIAEQVRKAVSETPKAKDGVSVVESIISREGHLIQMFSDGSTKDVGAVVGRDGLSVDKDYVLSELRRDVESQLSSWPRPRDGADGRPGQDGRDGSLEQLKMVQLDDFWVQFQFKDGTPVEGGNIRIPGIVYKDVWRHDETYIKDHAVTLDGSVFLAKRDDPGKPGVGDGWKLIVKRGQNGRNGRDLSGALPVVRT